MRFPVAGLLAVSFLHGAEELPDAMRKELHESISRVVRQMRSTPLRPLPPGAAAIRDLIRNAPEEPMSELSPPVVLTRTVLRESANRVTAWVEVVRIGSGLQVLLGDFGMVFVARPAVGNLRLWIPGQGVRRDPCYGLIMLS